MVINIKDYVNKCYSQQEGEIIYLIIEENINDEEIIISFDCIDVVTSSFVNTALISFMAIIDIDTIKRKFKIINSNKQINGMIKKRFDFEESRLVRNK